MQRWTTPEPLLLPISFSQVSRLDLEFVGLRRNVASFTALVFLNAEDLPRTAGRDHELCAGSFSIFGQGECWGDQGHCDWKRDPVSDFDRTPPHHLAPINLVMDVTPTMQHLGDPTELTVTIHAANRENPRARTGVIAFDRLEARAYQRSGSPEVATV
jgi:hypothetical protein